MKRIIAMLLALGMIFGFAACSPPEEKAAIANSDIYIAYTTDADKFIDIPNLRQYGNYSWKWTQGDGGFVLQAITKNKRRKMKNE